MLPLKNAFKWLCTQRKNASPNSDIWDLRLNINSLLPEIERQISAGTYTLSPVKRITINHKRTSLWTSKDSLVLKTITLILQKKLAPHLSPKCSHLKGNGGAKKSVRECHKNLHHPFVMRSDVKSYYASIDHHILFNQFCDLVKEPYLRRIVWQYLKRTVDINGNYVSIEKGISLGCPLSPLMAALYLKPLDDALAKLNVFYLTVSNQFKR
ncbi:MAG: reverse transcriptase domain-containing protein [Bdellovibrionota bacterium]|nr:reverse transcriptase domain-containing protein [Bdellovibrionota bacterium]